MSSVISSSSSIRHYTPATPAPSVLLNSQAVKKSGDGDGDHGQEPTPNPVNSSNNASGPLGSMINTQA